MVNGFVTTVFNFVDSKLNWGVSFHYNPLYLLFTNVEQGKEISYLPLSYLLFCQGFFFLPILVGLFLKFRFSLPFLIGVFSSLFFSIFVRDFLFWSALHVLPMVVLILGSTKRLPKLKLPLVFSGALLWTWCSGPVAFIGSFFLLWLISDEELPVKLLFLVSALVASVLFLVPFPMPHYPDGAQLSELSPSLLWPAQFLGPALNPNPLNYAEYSSRLSSYFGTAITNLLLVTALLIQLKNRGSISRELHILLLTSIFLVIESRSGGVVTQNLASVMYGLPLLPFPWLLGALGVLTGFGLFLNSSSSSSLPFNLGFVILVLFYLSNLVSNFDGDIVEAQQIGTQFSRNIVTDLNKVNSGNIHFRNLHSAEVTTNVNQGDAILLTDHRTETFWSTNGAMNGNEVIEIKLDQATNCPVLSLSPGITRATDFPRGIKVEVTDDGLNYRVAAEVPHWKGTIRATREGQIYFGPQNTVLVNLTSADKITGLRIYQTAKDPIFNWSVAEVRCGKP